MAIMEIVSTPTVRSLTKKTHADLTSRMAGICHVLGEAMPPTADMSRHDLARAIIAAMRRLPED